MTLELTELAASAWWEMDYDLDLDREAGTLAIDRKVIVTQATGEAWSDVALTLSTARPGEATGPTPVYPDQARIAAVQELARATAAPMAMEDAAGYAAAPEPMIEAEMKTASIDGSAPTSTRAVTPREAAGCRHRARGRAPGFMSLRRTRPPHRGPVHQHDQSRSSRHGQHPARRPPSAATR